MFTKMIFTLTEALQATINHWKYWYLSFLSDYWLFEDDEDKDDDDNDDDENVK